MVYFKNKFTEDKATGFLPGTNLVPINLVISHRLRVEINAQCNLAMAALQSEKEHFTLEQYSITADPKQNSPQDMYAWPGLVMVAANTGRHYKNGMEYTIKAFLDGKVVLSGDSGEFQLTNVEFFKSLRLKYAITYASAQGITIDGLLALHNTDHCYFNWKMLYVGSSRSTASNKLVVY